MIRVIILAALFALSACAATPDTGLAKPPAMPALPPELNQRAERLPDITDPSLGGLVIDGAETDRKYNDLAHRHNAVLKAWECIRRALAERSEAATCFK